MSSKKGKTTVEITDVRGSGNSSGGHIGTSVQVIKPITPTVDIIGKGHIDRIQTFDGRGGQTSSGGSIGFGIKW